MCGCNAGRGRKIEKWAVSYPDGTTIYRQSEVAAKLAAAAKAGGTYVKVSQ